MPDDLQFKMHGVPPRLRAAINREARSKKTSANDVVVAVLAKRFNHEYAMREAGFTGGIEGDKLNLRMPTSLHRAVKTSAAGSGSSMRVVILAELTLHFGIEPPGRRTRAHASA